jgi:maltooligosyltrehalose trehalohydrolase
MHEFTVWAPGPGRVELLLGDRGLPMRKAPAGWWTCRVPEAGPGTDYAFSLDGGPPRADPRSAFQPHGVEGPSRLVDHQAFAWTDDAWHGVPLPGSVIYEIHVGTFSPEGTFDAAIGRLSHLAELGVDLIELLPVAEFSGGRGWGYDGVNLFAPHHAYGGPGGLKRFVDAAHRLRIGVIIDVVYNHVGPAGNHLPEFGPYFAPVRTKWGDAVNFDGPGSGEVRRFVLDNAAMWLRDYHCDGLRVDAVHAIADSSAPHVLAELTAQVGVLAASTGKPLFVIAESDLNDPRLVRGRSSGGCGIDACWADDWHHAVHAALTGEAGGYYQDYGPLPLLARALRQAWVYDGCYSPHRGRVHGHSPAGLTGSQFVVCTQNHDQVGNRAAGERSAALMSGGRLRIAAALLLTSPFVPMLFQGEEWGASTPFPYFTDHADPGLGRAVAAGRRQEFAAFGWDPDGVPDPQDASTFESAVLDWAEPAKDGHRDLLAWYRTLIRLRRNAAALTDPRLEHVRTRFDESAGWLVVRRGPIAVAANLGHRNWTFPAGRRAGLLAGSGPGVRRLRDGIAVPPDSVAIVTDA